MATYSGEEFLTKIRKYVDACKKCGFCKAVCPVLKTSDHVETYGPRGRMLLLHGLCESKLKPREYLALRLYCTLCGYCSVKCVSGLELTDAYLEGRAYLRSKGVIIKEVSGVAENILRLGNPYGVDSSIKSMWIDFLPERPAGNSRTLYWSGCTTSIRRPETAVAAHELITEVTGDSVSVLDNEPCCGWPLYLNGDLEGYKEQLSKAFEAIKASGAEVVITTCPACTRSLRDKAKELGIQTDIKVYHIVEYLHQLLKEGKLPKLELQETITYHDPCELGRHMKVLKEPREIIERINGVKLVEMRGSGLESNCCGGGGLYLPLNPEGSSSIALSRLSDLPEGVKKLVTACPSCEVQLSTAVQNAGLDIEVLDISELVLRALNRSSR